MEVKGVLVFHASSCMDQDQPDASIHRLTFEQFEKLKQLCELEAKDYRKFDDEYGEYDKPPDEVVVELLPGECEQITHYITLESYYGSYVTNHFGDLTSIERED